MTQTSTARVSTTVPRRYLGQLCKHFDHKLPVELVEGHGRITFASGVCTLEAQTDTLVLRVESPDEATRLRTEDVVARHLLRFAFREPPEIVWVEDGQAAGS